MKTQLVLTIIFSTMICAGAYADITTGLVGYWSFDAGTAKDDSGTGNNGVIRGNPNSVDGKVGKAFDFDGEDDGVEIASNASLELANELTCAAWIYPRATQDAAGNDHAGICWKGNKIGWGSDVYNWRIATAGSDGLTWGSCGGGTEGYFATGGVLPAMETWYHVALVEDGSIGTAYVNGVALGDDATTGGDRNRPSAPYDVWPDEPVRIGWSQGRGGDVNTLVYFNGIIDEVVLYNRALSADEIGELMTSRPTAVEPTGKIASVWGEIKE